jgi:hypothetical protein
MTVDCQWIEKHLEALFSEELAEQESRAARAHIENCEVCKAEIQQLNAIDPVIKTYFRREMEIARLPRVIHKGRVFGLSTAAAAVAVVLLLMIVMRTPQPATVVSSPSSGTVANAPAPQTEPPTSAIKQNEQSTPQLSKPNPEPAARADRLPVVPPVAVSSSAPEFLLTDPAGYSHSLEDYRGHVVVIGVWRHDQRESIANLEQLYKTFATNSKIRFVGVPNDRQSKADNTTFPVLYNQGSKLFGAKAGEFVLLDENGSVESRGSLVKDFDSLTKTLRSK